MRVIIIAPGQVLPHLLSITNKNLEVAKIVVMDMQFAQGQISINGKTYNACSYDYLKEAVTDSYYDFILFEGTCEAIVLQHLKELGVSHKKIFLLNAVHRDRLWLHTFVHFFKCAVENISRYKIFITGISRGQCGTEISCYELPILRCASSSQDLYYDYQFAKKLLSMKGANFKYSIIELAPYIFHYDLSIGGSQQWLMLPYYMAFKDVHNFHVTGADIAEIFDPNFLNTDNLPVPKDFALETFPPHWEPPFTLENRIKVRELAEAWNKKRYPDTVRENEKIFADYIALCERHNILPIVVIFPSLDAYRNFFPKELMDELHYIVRRNGMGKRFIFIDAWNSDDKLFYNDFFDAVHLNLSGAKKFSSYLNGVIMRLETGGAELSGKSRRLLSAA